MPWADAAAHRSVRRAAARWRCWSVTSRPRLRRVAAMGSRKARASVRSFMAVPQQGRVGSGPGRCWDRWWQAGWWSPRRVAGSAEFRGFRAALGCPTREYARRSGIRRIWLRPVMSWSGFPAALWGWGEAVAALADLVDEPGRLQLGETLIDPGLLP